jgi:hypothetical protein
MIAFRHRIDTSLPALRLIARRLGIDVKGLNKVQLVYAIADCEAGHERLTEAQREAVAVCRNAVA